MATTTFKSSIKTEVDSGMKKFNVQLTVNGADAASALFYMPNSFEPTRYVMDGYQVKEAYMRRGLSYALTWVMLKAIKAHGGTHAVIRSAHRHMYKHTNYGFSVVEGSVQPPRKRGQPTRVPVVEEEKKEEPKAPEDQQKDLETTVNVDTTIGQLQTALEKAECEFKANSCCPCCYITTAVCQALQLPDDCPGLTTLRAFRDEVLLSTTAGIDDVQLYYLVAPEVVSAIDGRGDAAAIYADLNGRFIAPSLHALAAGEPAIAHGLFKAMLRETAHIYLPKGSELLNGHDDFHLGRVSPLS